MELGFDFTAMATPCEIRLQGPDEARLRAAAQGAIAEVRRIEARYSRYRADSVVAAINAAAGDAQAVAIDEETAGLLDFGGALHDLSEGRFDLTSGVLRRCWDFRAGRLPGAADVARLLPLVAWPRVERGPAHVRLPLAGMEIDFGGIGKEYACDRAAGLLMSLGLRHGWVDLGGDIRVLGPREDGGAWRFGIRHPQRAGDIVASIDMRHGALATSGDAERFIQHDGRRYGHLLDARTGWPAGHWASASVVAPTCAAAGAASTLACLLGARAGGFLDAQGVDWCLVDADGSPHPSEGWAHPARRTPTQETCP